MYLESPYQNMVDKLEVRRKNHQHFVTGKVLEILYSRSFLITPASCEIRRRVTQLRAKVGKWQSDLPEPLRFTRKRRCALAECYRVSLALQCHSMEILIGKPCLDYLKDYDTSISDFDFQIASTWMKSGSRDYRIVSG
jgi:hypothetical protein